MGYNWPRINECFGVLPLRQGVLYGAALGGVWGAAHVAAYCVPSAALAAAVGARVELVRRAHGALGVLLLTTHALLAAAARRQDRELCALYVRVLPLLCFSALLLLATAATLTGAAGLPLHTGLIVAFSIIIMTGSLYFIIIVANFSATIRA